MLIINTHSFVDLITNSSSELFVCDTDKTLTAVKNIIEKITRNYYDEMSEDCPNIWQTIFNEPIVFKKDFDLRTFPDQEIVRMAFDYSYEINTKIDWKTIDKARQQIIDYFDIQNCQELLNWDISVRKGNILLESASDNSVPYEIWDRIENILNARRYHLG
jgi:hypothetical protein